MRYHLLKKFFGKMVKIKETFSFLLERILIFCHHCRIRVEGNGYGLFAQNQAGMHLDTKFPLGFFYPFCIQMELDICLNNNSRVRKHLKPLTEFSISTRSL